MKDWEKGDKVFYIETTVKPKIITTLNMPFGMMRVKYLKDERKVIYPEKYGVDSIESAITEMIKTLKNYL